MAGEDVRVTIGADTGPFATGMASLRNVTQQVGSEIKNTLGGFLGFAAVTAEFQKVLSKAEQIHDTAARFHIDAEQLQILANVAQDSGVGMEQLGRAMNLIAINAQKAVDPTTKQALAAERLNIVASEFAKLSPWDQVLKLSDAYADSAKDGRAFADISELIGKKNLDMIPFLEQGSAAILNRAKDFQTLTTQEVDELDHLKDEEDRYLNHLHVFVAEAIVGWGRLFSFIAGNKNTFGAAAFTDEQARLAKLMLSPPAGTATGGGGGSIGAAGGATAGEAALSETIKQNRLQQLNIEGQINELVEQRQFLEAALKSGIEQGIIGEATQYDIKKQIAEVDKQLIPLQVQHNIEEQKGVDLALRKVQASQNQVEIEDLLIKAKDAAFRGDIATSEKLQEQANLLKIQLDFNEKIQQAIDKANEERAKGNELTAKANELIAQQLETEKQKTLEMERQDQLQKQQVAAATQIRDAAANLAFYNLRVGATPDVYAQALAASRGIQPGTKEYEALIQKIRAEDQLRLLQGQTLSFEDQLGRDKLVQWFSDMQAKKAESQSNQTLQDQIAYWKAIAAGQTPAPGNPFINLYGTGAPPTGANQATEISIMSQQLSVLQQINKNLTPAPGT